MFKDNCHLACDEKHLLIGQINVPGGTYVGLSGFKCYASKIGISVDSRTTIIPAQIRVKVAGEEGFSLDGTGIRVGVNSAQMYFGRIQVWLTPPGQLFPLNEDQKQPLETFTRKVIEFDFMK